MKSMLETRMYPPASMKVLLKKMRPYVMRYPFMLFASLFFLLLASFMTLSLPLVVQKLIDHGLSADSGFHSKYLRLLIILSAFLALASACRHYFVMTLGERVVADLRQDLLSHLISLSPAFFDRVRPTEVISFLIADTVQIRSAAGGALSFALRNLILAVSAAGMMFVTSPKLTAIVLALIPVIVFPLVLLGRIVKEKSCIARDTLSNAATFAGEKIAHIQIMQAFTAEAEIIRDFSQISEKTFQTVRQVCFIRSILIFCAIFVVFSSVSGVFWLGSRDLYSGAISAGKLGQFILYAIFAAASLASFSELWSEFIQAAAAFERIAGILEEKPAVVSSPAPIAFSQEQEGSIEFRDVTFAYPLRPDFFALKRFSLSVRPGEKVALVGPSGGGKSTIFSLLQRFYDPQEGAILLDGVDVRDADLFALRQRMASVPQEAPVFSGSIRNNIALGDPSASFEKIQLAARRASAETFINRFPERFETEVGERGFSLSGGQRQRLAIARAVLRNAPILLLDEATSSLDAENEHHVQQMLQELMQNKTTIVITHRLATVLKADRIIVVVNGQIVEEGTHFTLMKKKGVYAGLARIQFDIKEELS